MPFYACAPNDIWSLGVILVNLTCGRNPWKSASTKDSTFRAYLADRQFLKSILPLSDELNEILNMVFEIDPSRRISLAELRHRIATCPAFTKPAGSATTTTTTTTSVPAVVPTIQVTADAFVDSDSDLDVYSAALSPASTISEEGSMISDVSDTSTAPSEAGSPQDLDVQFDVMDEDHPEDHSTSFDDFAPATAKDPWVAEPAFVAPYVPVDPVVPSPPVFLAPSPKDRIIPPQPRVHQQRFLSPPRSAPPRQQKSMHQFIARCVTPSLLNSFCPQGSQRGTPVRRAF